MASRLKESRAWPRARGGVGRGLCLGGVGNHSVDFSAFVTFGEIFGDRHAIFADEEEAVAVFVDLHFVAGTDPAA